LRQPLKAGRYLFANSPPSGTVDGLQFTLTETDLTPNKVLAHVAVENRGPLPGGEPPRQGWHTKRHVPFGLVMVSGETVGYTAVCVKEGAIGEDGTEMRFPPEGGRGAFVMEFAPLQSAGATLSTIGQRRADSRGDQSQNNSVLLVLGGCRRLANPAFLDEL